MFGFIKKLFGGITAFLGGLFGGKKSQADASAPQAKKSKGYFLELDETGSAKSATEAKKPEPAKAEAKAPAAQAEPAKASVATATLEKPKAEPAKASENGKVNQIKVEAQPNPPAAANNGRVEPQAGTTFAPTYLIPTPTNSRRRPGPSMDTFRDMARQVKTPNNK